MIAACTEIVARDDPHLHATALFARPPVRARLMVLYAFDIELSRATHASKESLIPRMRLQWWRDALEEIAGAGIVRKHEVTSPLADVLDDEGARCLDALVAARRWDLYRDAFEDAEHFQTYLDATGGGLMWVGARALGATDEATFRVIGRASALANLFLAVPTLEQHGCKPMVDGRPEAIRNLASQALSALESVRPPSPGRAATFAAWRTKTLLKRAVEDPRRVADGSLAESEFRRRLSLVLARARL